MNMLDPGSGQIDAGAESFAEAECVGKKKTRRDKFLAEIEQGVAGGATAAILPEG